MQNSPNPATGHDYGTVAILMAVRNGARFLGAQLDSIARQSVPRIDLWISDDGSNDTTRDIIAETARHWDKGTLTLFDGPQRGFAENFRSLLVRDEIDADFYAFSDQDDSWDEDKLAHALVWLERQANDRPALYCSRTRIMTEDGVAAGLSPLFAQPPSFRNALVQSIAGANTMVMNRAARDLVATASRRSGFVSHDWWCYLLVAGAGGVVHYSAEPRIGYRQHGANLVGESDTWRARLSRMCFLFKGRFKEWNDLNLAGLRINADLLTEDARQTIATFERSRHGSLPTRLAALHRAGVYRQTRLGAIGLVVACAARRL